MAETSNEKPKRRRAAPKPAEAATTKRTAATKAAKPAAQKPAATRREVVEAAAPVETPKPKRAPRRAVAKTAPEAVPAPTPAPPAEAVRANAAGLAAAIGGLAVAAGAFVLWRTTRAEEPIHEVLEQDGPIELRRYPQQVTAATEASGLRRDALNQGFRTLADYIFAKSRPGEKIPMTAPVLSDAAGSGRWRTRFLMPAGQARSTLPTPPVGVELSVEAGARVAAIRFAGKADDKTLDAKEGALRSWLQLRGLPSDGKPVYAFYNAPFLPGPFRRNEVLITLSSEGGVG